MQLNKNLIPSWYFKLFNWVAENRIKENDLELRDIHSSLAMTLTTSLLMWGYGFLAYFTISSPIPWIVGFICSFIHLLSPILFRVSNNTFLITNIALLAGVTHQGTYTYYTGGFLSHILIWYGLIPVLGGLVAGPRGGILWFFITIFISLCYFILHLVDYPFPDLISEMGLLWTHAMLVFGWIFLSSAIVVVYGSLREHTEMTLKKQSEKIEELFRVLFHDLANPLSRLSIGLSMAEKTMENADTNRGLIIAKSSTQSMLEITQNVRNIYAANKGKADFKLKYVPLNSSITYLTKLYSPELLKKNIQLSYDFKEHERLNLLVDSVSFNNQVLGNILSNAIKFSHPNSEIEIQVYEAESGLYQLQIKDHGVGIPSSMINDLFDYNKKVSRPGTLGEMGSGFGMQIMQSFVTLYGGKIEVESEVGAGTTIKIFIKGKIE